MRWLWLLVFLCPIPALAHNAPLDAYGCHADSARFGNSAQRECHADLLAGQVFASTTAEYKAYIAAQKILLSQQQTLIADLTAKLATCTARCPVVGQAVLSWTPNTDTDLAGYKVYKGTASRIYQSPPLTVSVMTLPTVTIQNLPAGTYYFAVTAYDKAGNESGFSQEVEKVIP